VHPGDLDLICNVTLSLFDVLPNNSCVTALRTVRGLSFESVWGEDTFCLAPVAKVVNVRGSICNRNLICSGRLEYRIPTFAAPISALMVIRLELLAARPLSYLCPRTGIKFFMSAVRRRDELYPRHLRWIQIYPKASLFLQI
jgi:hypothetical protein